MVRALCAVVVCAAVLVATDASAQLVKWTDNGFVALNGGVQISGQDVVNSLNIDTYGETSTVDAPRHIGGGMFFDLAAGRRLWNNAGAGFTFSRRSNKADVAMTSSIPDPIFFDQPRVVTATLADMKFSETTFAPIALMGFPISDVLDAIGFLGPVVRSVHQELVTGASIAETGAAPSVTPTREEVAKKFLGIQIGVDLQYRLTKEFAAGGFVRYTGGGGHLTNEVELDAPGVQIGVGGRYKF
jgi:hypothetical protein